MPKIETVVVKSDGGDGYKIINKSDMTKDDKIVKIPAKTEDKSEKKK